MTDSSIIPIYVTPIRKGGSSISIEKTNSDITSVFYVINPKTTPILPGFARFRICSDLNEPYAVKSVDFVYDPFDTEAPKGQSCIYFICWSRYMVNTIPIYFYSNTIALKPGSGSDKPVFYALDGPNYKFESKEGGCIPIPDQNSGSDSGSVSDSELESCIEKTKAILLEIGDPTMLGYLGSELAHTEYAHTSANSNAWKYILIIIIIVGGIYLLYKIYSNIKSVR
jgi:hypothetical protein